MSTRKTKDFGSCNVLFDTIAGVGNSSFALNKGSLLLLPPRSKGITSKSRADSFSVSFYISSFNQIRMPKLRAGVGLRQAADRALHRPHRQRTGEVGRVSEGAEEVSGKCEYIRRSFEVSDTLNIALYMYELAAAA